MWKLGDIAQELIGHFDQRHLGNLKLIAFNKSQQHVQWTLEVGQAELVSGYRGFGQRRNWWRGQSLFPRIDLLQQSQVPITGNRTIVVVSNEPACAIASPGVPCQFCTEPGVMQREVHPMRDPVTILVGDTFEHCSRHLADQNLQRAMEQRHSGSLISFPNIVEQSGHEQVLISHSFADE